MQCLHGKFVPSNVDCLNFFPPVGEPCPPRADTQKMHHAPFRVILRLWAEICVKKNLTTPFSPLHAPPFVPLLLNIGQNRAIHQIGRCQGSPEARIVPTLPGNHFLRQKRASEPWRHPLQCVILIRTSEHLRNQEKSRIGLFSTYVSAWQGHVCVRHKLMVEMVLSFNFHFPTCVHRQRRAPRMPNVASVE
jgi:hypothetical protein